MISVPGIGSGLDINAIVEGLVSAESDAKTQLLASRRSDIQSEISAFGNLKSVVDTLRSSAAKLANANTFTAYTATSSDTSYFTVSSNNSAAAGIYDIEVRALAESQKLMTAGFADADTNVGTGTISITTGGESFDVLIDSENQTLTDIRNAINNAEDNTGVSATLLTVDDGAGGTLTKLILTADQTGTENAITVNVTDDDGNHTDGNGLSVFYYDTSDDNPTPVPEQMTEINPAVDAELYIDNQRILSSSNTVNGALEGVTLNLSKAETGVTNTLTIAPNNNAVKSNIQSFVTSYNNFISLTNSLTDFNVETGVAGILIGDATVRALSNGIRVNLSSSLPGNNNEFKNLVDLGITTNANGLLEIDSSKLDSALSSSSNEVAALFSSENGIATKLNNFLNEYVRADGIFENKTDGLNETVDDINEDLESLALSMQALEERLFAQFTTLDFIMTQLNSTSSFLTQQFEQISNITQINNPR